MFFTEYIYDENGNFLKRVNYKGDADCECIYDEKGNLIQEKTYFDFGAELHIDYKYAYDENNNIIKIEEKMQERKIVALERVFMMRKVISLR